MALVTVQRSPSSNESPTSSDVTDGVKNDKMDNNRNPKSLSECYFASKGTALVLPAAEAQIVIAPTKTTSVTTTDADVDDGSSDERRSFGGGQSSNIQKHLQSMFHLLRDEETLKMAVKLESVHPIRTRYLVVVSRMGRRGEESCLLGIDCNEKTTVGLVLKVMADTTIRLDGDGGFSVSVCGRYHIFKPVSVQAMWSALQTLHKASAKAREHNYFQGGLTHDWVDYYERRIESDRSCLNEWHAMDNLESKRPPSPDSIRTKPTEREETERVIRTTLKEIMMSVDLDEVTSKYIRGRLEEDLNMDLGEYKSFIDQEMLTILGQMDAPTEIFEHVYLGSEWNASNYEELQRNGVGHILNVTREIDNFFPGTFDYLNVRVLDDEKTDLLKHWDDTFKYITKARKNGSKVLVHCKMGVSRSASVVIAYAMKAYNWDFHTAMDHVKCKRSCIKPNTSFLTQLQTYQGILDAMKNKEKLQRSKSETNLKSPKTHRRRRTGNNDENADDEEEEDNSSGGESTISCNTEERKIKKIPPGGEPTPMLQALSKSHELQTTRSGPDLRQLETRPKSWSSPSGPGLDDGKRSPAFLSLEDLSQRSEDKNARNVLMPCDNGESYSVSPNRIFHLPHEKKDDAEKNDVWDPGEDKDAPPAVWTSSTFVKNIVGQKKEGSDMFSNQLDKVFDREEKKQQRHSVVVVTTITPTPIQANEENGCGTNRECPSRQSSWSSYDSAVVLNYADQCYAADSRDGPTALSRHSSWGSGDTRTLPSRNSSWGSYDMRPNDSIKSVTTDTSQATPSVGVSPYDREDIPWQTGTVRRTRQKLEETVQQKTSDELKRDERTRLSVSAPQCTTLLEYVPSTDVPPLSRSASNVADMQRHSADETNTAGLVRSLKKEFEAKGDDETTTKTRVNSLPTSPVAIHHQQQPQQEDDAKFKNLVGLFERRTVGGGAKVRNAARFSCIETTKEDESKGRPPISPTVRNGGTNGNSPSRFEVAATVISKAVKKQQQQYGKSHPLARLNIKPRHNSPVYNTM